MPQFDRMLRILVPGLAIAFFAIWFDALTQEKYVRALLGFPGSFSPEPHDPSKSSPSAVPVPKHNSESVKGLSQLFGAVFALIGISFPVSTLIVVALRTWPFNIEARHESRFDTSEAKEFDLLMDEVPQFCNRSVLGETNCPMFFWTERNCAASVARVAIFLPEISAWLQMRSHQIWIGASVSTGIGLLAALEAIFLFWGYYTIEYNNAYFAFLFSCWLCAGTLGILSSLIASHEIKQMTIYCLRRPILWREHFRLKNASNER